MFHWIFCIVFSPLQWTLRGLKKDWQESRSGLQLRPTYFFVVLVWGFLSSLFAIIVSPLT